MDDSEVKLMEVMFTDPDLIYMGYYEHFKEMGHVWFANRNRVSDEKLERIRENLPGVFWVYDSGKYRRGWGEHGDQEKLIWRLEVDQFVEKRKNNLSSDQNTIKQIFQDFPEKEIHHLLHSWNIYLHITGMEMTDHELSDFVREDNQDPIYAPGMRNSFLFVDLVEI
ncbi:MAG: hypothetical protein ACTSU5_16230 [Promethearchaeota archaeon]